MPSRNYARDALVQHCLEAAHNDIDRATDILRTVVQEQRDFLVPFACVPKNNPAMTMYINDYISQRFNAKTWMEAHCTKNTVVHHSYVTLLARAYLLTPGLVLPEDQWEDDGFIQAFRKEAQAIIGLRVPPRRHNLNNVRNHAIAGPIVCEIESVFPAEAQRYMVLYDEMLGTLHQGIPPYTVVEHLLGAEDERVYKELIESIEMLGLADFDVDSAMQQGRKRQLKDAGTWRARDVMRIIDILNIYKDGHEQGLPTLVIGEEFERFRNRETLRRNHENAGHIKAAEELGAWRIRRVEIQMWRQHLPREVWAAYQRCEMAMRDSLPPGVYSQIPRRKFNMHSLKHMQTTNIFVLCTKLFVTPPPRQP